MCVIMATTVFCYFNTILSRIFCFFVLPNNLSAHSPSCYQVSKKKFQKVCSNNCERSESRGLYIYIYMYVGRNFESPVV